MLALYIDDDDLNRRVMREILATADVEMHEADNGPDGMTKIDEHGYDFILVDLRMPGMNGLEVVRAIRNRRGYKAKTPTIVVTADRRPNLSALCVAAGADELILKPVEMTLIFETVGRVLAGHGSTPAHPLP